MQEVRNPPFATPVSVLLRSDAAKNPNRKNAAYRDRLHRAFRPEAENVWVPVISKQAGATFIPERKPPRFRQDHLSPIFRYKSRKK
jgi:hypothetical protein